MDKITDIQGFADRVRKARSLLPLTREQFCNHFQFNRHMLYAWEMAQVDNISEEYLQKFCSILQENGIFCSVIWLLTGDGHEPSLLNEIVNQPGARIVTVQRGRLYKSQVKNPLNAITEEIRIFYLVQSLLTNNQVWVLSLNDHYMSPLYEKGDFVGVRKTENSKISVEPQTFMLETQPGHYYLRKVRITDDNKFRLHGASEDFAHQVLEDLHAVYEVIWHRKNK